MGDSFTGGLYDGLELAGKHDIIVVSHEYRLGTLGFNTWVKGPNNETGTQGMADQRLALKWTHTNIAGFGGDPKQVTIFGESAGGMSVLYHLVSPPSWPYFSRAIIESGPASLQWFFQPRDDAGKMFDDWAAAIDCVGEGEDRLSCLMQKPFSELLTTPDMACDNPGYPEYPVGPVVDGTEHGLLDVPSNLIQAGRFKNVPLLFGHNRDDGLFFTSGNTSWSPWTIPRSQEDIDKLMNLSIPLSDKAKVKAMYDVQEFQRWTNRNPYNHMAGRMLRDAIFACPERRVAQAWQNAGVPAYVYVFDFSLGFVAHDVDLGTFHSSELPFVFGTFLKVIHLLPRLSNIRGMSAIMSCQWTAFARHGDPNGGGPNATASPGCEDVHGVVDEWPAFGASRAYYSLQDSPATKPEAVELRPGNRYPDDSFPADDRCDMWDTITLRWAPWKPATPALSPETFFV
eukprot:NODE_5863_length_1727_cov_5.056250.p1 GENE.NODE_5863_length_1727_cov_5.056250~~NODE_5863_length_1727_cov_5.056250.p1  ORF type:complete len:493 (-),score=107.64 NODE_5863_length_1727_cov_5.056250:249-1616(-)